jgi:predicted SAM-dependent methyltransferase
MNRVNLGCGDRYRPGWINIDIRPCGPGVIAHDLRKGIPLETGSCDLVYHSHLLEHLSYDAATVFMKECFRVLKPGGVIRVVVPDLEVICRLYLQKLDAVLAGDESLIADYEWMTLELLDQMARERGGGRIAEELRRTDLSNRDFVRSRIGNIVDVLEMPPPVAPDPPGSLAFVGCLRMLKNRARNLLLRLALDEDGRRALLVGCFHTSGELHHWMYDRLSLCKLLRSVGFESPLVQFATRSLVNDWPIFRLDTDENDKVIKPDSLFMEAIKPPIPVEEGHAHASTSMS